MDHQSKIKYLLASSYTGQGYFSFIPELIKGLNKVYLLKGEPGSGKSTLLKKLGESLAEFGYTVELWFSPLSSNSFEGMRIDHLKTAIINSKGMETDFLESIEIACEIIDLDEYWRPDSNWPYRERLLSLTKRIKDYHLRVEKSLYNAYKNDRRALEIDGYNLDQEAINKTIAAICESSFVDRSREKHYFVSTVNIDGKIDYSQMVTSDSSCRYLICGPYGCGQNQVIKGVAEAAIARGYLVEYYHDGLNIDKINMIVIADIQIAVLDLSCCKLDIRPNDVFVDMCELNKMDETEHLTNLQRLIDEEIMSAQMELEKIYDFLRVKKRLYASAMDFDGIERKRRDLLNAITMKTNI